MTGKMVEINSVDLSPFSHRAKDHNQLFYKKEGNYLVEVTIEI